MPEAPPTITVTSRVLGIELPYYEGNRWTLNPTDLAPIGGAILIPFIGRIPAGCNPILLHFKCDIDPAYSPTDIRLALEETAASKCPGLTNCRTRAIDSLVRRSDPYGDAPTLGMGGPPAAWGIGYQTGEIVFEVYFESNAPCDNLVTLGDAGLSVTATLLT